MLSSLLPFSHIESHFILNGKKYEVEHFKVGFAQPTDYRGQPQHEIKGGHINITLTRAADDILYHWAKTSTLQKSGMILFQTDLGITVLRVMFENGYCVNLSRDIDSVKGSTTTLVISAEKISLNGLEYDNFWPEK